MTKLNLNKETIAALDNRTMSEVKGGFLYSLSTGYRCRGSKAYGASNAYECGEIRAQQIAENEAKQASLQQVEAAPYLTE